MKENFKSDLKRLSSKQLYRKYILRNDSPILDIEKLFNLKESICDFFSIDYNDVLLVGSAKLGFSIKPTKRYKDFSDDSDIDIAIASTSLFTQIWKEIIEYEKSGSFWPKKADFFYYISLGWIRPDMLPTSQLFNFTEKWWGFFNQLSVDFGKYMVRGGLYHSWFFLENYQTVCIEKCIQESLNENIRNE